MDYLPGGRRYRGDGATPSVPRERPVILDLPKPEQPAPVNTTNEDDETEAQVAKRLLPGLEKNLEKLRAQGLPEDSSQIQYHVTTIKRLRRKLQLR
jgi:hypothetical protein